ncbi:MAG: class I SAM-dependent methyltransferase [Patescibacteria group bacterium]|nr:class I SAM-dependent methyltransferase [Patescibacteria group bacterium]MBU1350187.1 class I SAM-dependent methyltransferase [Patescibacteria group bacterium]MBU1421280.1 class I SAM-dependent methyltransferase [Patescibacteria group bacterium]MBU2456689.1 class I SAM-dependent methyltransferase [Patescibacteria group bacterium]MBU2474769.1 class I SAM-dependent methyltransferase [Patescibacteria group bacterium]
MSDFTERLILDNKSKNNIIYNEHLVRYEFVKQFVKNKKVLDIACGSGYGSKILAKAGAGKVVAIDVDEEAIKFAKQNYGHKNIEYQVGNAEEIGQGSNIFDIISSFETIEHLQNPNKFLSELSRVAKDNGLVIISTPNKDVFKQKNPFHLKEFSKTEFEEILGKYFKFHKILEQGNGMTSCILSGTETDIRCLSVATDRHRMSVSAPALPAPLYFIAICSQEKDAVENLQIQNMASINFTALEKLYNNPVLKISDKIYSWLKKLINLIRPTA